MRSSEKPRGTDLLLGLSAMSLSIVALALLELAHIPKQAYGARPLLFPQAFFYVSSEALVYCWGNLVAGLGLILLSQDSPLRRILTPTRRLLAQGLLSALPSVGAYLVLRMYEPFAYYPPFLLCFAGLFLLTWGAAYVLTSASVAQTIARGAAWVRLLATWLPPFFLLVAALVLSLANYRAYKGLYPTLHLSALLVTHLLLLLASWHALDRAKASSLRFFNSLGAVSLALMTIAPLVRLLGWIDGSRPHAMAYTATGQSKIVFHRFKSSGAEGRPSLKPDTKALARFDEQSGFPPLPSTFNLGDYNVLLITSEATRFDRTSLSEGDYELTPHLLRLRDHGAFSFSRAYSASSGTLHSIASVMGMTFPSALHLETYKKPWHGTLLNDRPIVPQLFHQADYRTFWIGHSYRNCFQSNIRGFEHGFEEQQLFVETKDEPSRTLDRDIADAAIARLERAALHSEKFFGWIFFGGPHSPYVAHETDSKAESDHDRYLQELKEMDRNFGRLLDALESKNLLDKTVILYFGDHGEEFGEHGGAYHKASVYAEVVHVPLLVRVPGLPGRVIDQPASTYYSFPWLLRRGTGKMKAAAETRIIEEIGPMMRATRGGVLVELIGHDRMFSSLIYPEHKFNYDFLSSMFEVHDLAIDPGEQRNLFDTQVHLAERAVNRISSYKKVRAARANYILLPDDKR